MTSVLLAAAVLLTAPCRADAPPPPLSGGHFYLGPGLRLNYAGGAQGVSLAAALAYDFGDWMGGVEALAGVIRSPTFALSIAGRVDRFLQAASDSIYVGGTLGAMDQFDGENFGGDGAFAGAQAGYLWGRSRRWGRAAIELQLSVPLFGERAGKPGDYVYPFLSLNFRLFL
ncbi:MAG TPA: hypothetical protein VFL36_07760 [Myxococcales bacterium]|nr:hypothetical protein [Myxococcales bacterium]